MAKYGYVRVPYTHPGFPETNAIETFKANAKTSLDEGQQEMDKLAQKIRVKNGPKGEQLRKRKNMGRFKKKPQGPMKFEFYFDSAAYEIINKQIREQIKEGMKGFMESATRNAAKDTKNQIKNMPRKFKGKLNPTKKAAGDFYDTIADSLDVVEKTSGKQPNQFTSFTAGSFDGESPTGVKGSRGANLLEIQGMGSFKMTRSPFGGTKRLGASSIISKLKGR
tara:strand:- start:7302 stop:7967 length:666 start_codon:yes stop_codon:yes gene_type:complete